MTEGMTTEFKREYTDEIKKTVIACPYYLAAKGLRPEGALSGREHLPSRSPGAPF